MMEINLEKYSSKQILASYEFILIQYLGGQIQPKEIVDQVPTVYIFGLLCVDLRSKYLERKDSDLDEITKVETETIHKVADLWKIPPYELKKMYQLHHQLALDYIENKNNKL